MTRFEEWELIDMRNVKRSVVTILGISVLLVVVVGAAVAIERHTNTAPMQKSTLGVVQARQNPMEVPIHAKDATVAGGAGKPIVRVVNDVAGSFQSDSHSTNMAAFVPGQMIVKFKSAGPFAVTQCTQQWLEEKRSFVAATADASDSLDKMNQEVGVKRAWSLLPDRYGKSTARAQKVMATRISALGKKIASQRNLSLIDQSLAEIVNIYILEIPSHLNVEKVCRRYQSDPHVEYAQPNYLTESFMIPNDPYYHTSGSWGQVEDDLWALKKISCPAAWDVTQGEQVVVAVADSGLDMAHPDISANVWSNPAEIPGNGIDDDNNGFVDDVHGWNFKGGNNDPTDEFGHGTHVSGTIAAAGNNGIGIIGVAPKAKIMPLKFSDNTGSGDFGQAARAIIYAASNGADVINNSYGCSNPCPTNPIAEDAVRFAHQLGAVVVFAAGNSGVDIVDYSPQNQPQVIVVGSSNQSDEGSYFSNTGVLDVSAPGSGAISPPPWNSPSLNILSLKSTFCNPSFCPPEFVVGTNYLRKAGTSMSAPHVTGLAALVRSKNPGFSPEQVRQVIRRGSTDLEPVGYDLIFGYGRINAAATLAEGEPLEALILQPLDRIGPETAVVEVKGTAQGPGFVSWRLEFALGSTPETWTILASASSPVGNGTLTALDTRTVADGTYSLRLVATNSQGRIYEDRQQLIVDRVFLTAPNPNEVSMFRSGSVVSVLGTVAPAGFSSYRLHLIKSNGEEVTNTSFTLTNGGLAPVHNDVLGTWTVPSTQDRYTLILEVTTATNSITKHAIVTADPTLRLGFPVQLEKFDWDGISFFSLGNHLDAADVNNDGRAEILVGYGKSVMVFDANGVLLPGWPQDIDPDHLGTKIQVSPAVGDVLGEGVPQIVAVNTYGHIFLWRGDGTLVPGWPKGNSSACALHYLALADLNGDGRDEIVTTDWAGKIKVTDRNGVSLQGWPKTLDGEEYLSPPVIGDVDGDGVLEIAVASSEPQAYLYLFSATGNELPGWPKTINQAPGFLWRSVSIPVFADLDGDRDLEIVIGSDDGRVCAFHHNGEAVSGWPRMLRDSYTDTPVAGDVAQYLIVEVIAGDVDGDGKAEVLVSANGINNVLYLLRGNGEDFSPWPLLSSQEGLPFEIGGLADVDGDGRVEVVVSGGGPREYSMQAYHLDKTPVALFPKPTITMPFAENRNTAAIADLDGDGLLEVAWIDFDLRLIAWDLNSAITAPQPWPMFGHDARHTAGGFNLQSPTLTATAVSSSEITLSWNAIAGATGYRLDVSTDGSFTTFVPGYENREVGAVTAQSVTNVRPGVRYFVRVRASGPWGTSLNSVTASAFIPGARRFLHAVR